ncbi:adenosine deaminase, tRNA-specific 1 [Leptinotarsa decemlineata]|uniref:adenosine deaminase, tRNA-specific 1 n=1 Tax=Leptinotarsa decemlineata TaxID=7539 RepID=UPI003D309689
MENSKDFYEKIAELCLDKFKALPKSGKPNLAEWTVLSCIVMELKGDLSVVALGTGSKCIGKTKMSDTGGVLNDSHAEVICRRSFLRFMYYQMKIDSSLLHFNEDTKKFAMNCNAQFHFFTTQVPCGDAAIFPKQKTEDIGDVMEEGVPSKKRKRNDDDDDLFRTGAKCLEDSQLRDMKLPGTGYHILGAVRTKPGRGDPTLSVSCSDKLSRWCHLGIQGALLSLLLERPIYLSSFIITSNTPFSETSLERALYGRVGNISLNYPYLHHKMNVFRCSKEFEFSKTDGKQASPTSISWCDVNEKSLEVAVDGRRQGITKKKANTEMAYLRICKRELFKNFLIVCETKNIMLKTDCDNCSLTYESVKNFAEQYQKSWNMLRKSFEVWTYKDKNLNKFSIK